MKNFRYRRRSRKNYSPNGDSLLLNDEKMITYLIGQLKDATNEVILHGACLGLGLAAMATGRKDVYELLKNKLQDRLVRH